MLHTLPKDIITTVLSYLNDKERLKASLVCKNWYRVINADDIVIAKKGIASATKEKAKYSPNYWHPNQGWRALTFQEQSAWSHGDRVFAAISLTLLLCAIIEACLYMKNSASGDTGAIFKNGLPAICFFAATWYVIHPSNSTRITDFFANRQKDKISKHINSIDKELNNFQKKLDNKLKIV